MKKMVDGSGEPPWCIVVEVDKIKQMMSSFNLIIQHIFRYGNTLATTLTNIAFDFAGEVSFNSFSELPSVGTRILNLDKAHIHNLRIKSIQKRASDG